MLWISETVSQGLGLETTAIDYVWVVWAPVSSWSFAVGSWIGTFIQDVWDSLWIFIRRLGLGQSFMRTAEVFVHVPPIRIMLGVLSVLWSYSYEAILAVWANMYVFATMIPQPIWMLVIGVGLLILAGIFWDRKKIEKPAVASSSRSSRRQ